MSDLNVFLGDVQISVNGSRSGFSWNMDATIYVRNLAYNKAVGLWMEINGLWRAFEARYSSSLMTGGGNLIEKWEVPFSTLVTLEIPAPPPRLVFRFAVYFHDLDGHAWYWDNNFGRDYLITV